MRFLIFTFEFPPAMGGAGTYAADLAVGLCALGHEVMVLAPDYPQFGAEVRQIDRARPHGIKRMELAANQAKYLQGTWYLDREVRHFRPDVLLVADGASQRAAAVLAACRPGLRYAVMVHGSEVIWHFRTGGAGARLTRGLMRRFFKRAGRVVCNSNHTRRVLLETLPWLADKTAVTPLGIDLGRLPPAADEDVRRVRQGLDLPGPVLLTVARVIPGKGHEAVIKALPLLTKTMPALRYLVVGDGPHVAHLRALGVRLGIGSNVIFTGRVPRGTIGLHYALADALIMLSGYSPNSPVSESFGLAFLEAWACGKPVIGSRNGAIPEVIDHGVNGLLVDDTDAQQVAEAIRFLLDNPGKAREMGANGRRKVENEFSAVAMAERTVAALSGASRSSAEAGHRGADGRLEGGA